MDATRARAIQYGLAILLVAAIAAAFAIAGRGGDAPTIPDAIERLSPADGTQVPRQQPVVVDLAAGLEAELFIRDPSSGVWAPVPANETAFEPGTGVLTWSPGPATARAGQLHLRVEFRSVSGPLRAGSHEWSFRTY